MDAVQINLVNRITQLLGYAPEAEISDIILSELRQNKMEEDINDQDLRHYCEWIYQWFPGLP